MLKTWKTFWRWLTTGRYTRTLEDEVERLRGENRALLNSLLGTAGFPPLPALPLGGPEGRPAGSGGVPPVRRRSWHQIAARREWEAAGPTPPAIKMGGPPPARQTRHQDGRGGGPFH